jgi:hypothetical protein
MLKNVGPHRSSKMKTLTFAEELELRCNASPEIWTHKDLRGNPPNSRDLQKWFKVETVETNGNLPQANGVLTQVDCSRSGLRQDDTPCEFACAL